MRFVEIIAKNRRLNEISDRVKTRMRDQFKQQDPDLTDQQINFYLDKWDQYAQSFPADQRDITQLTFRQVEQLIDAAVAKQQLRGRKKQSTKTAADGAMPGYIYNKNNLVIYRGDSKAKCIQYGQGYTWCISRLDSSNLYTRYRFGSSQPVFYFVFDRDLRREDPWHAVVIYVTRNNRYMVATSLNQGDQQMSWESIAERQPKLAGLQKLFRPQPPSKEEQADYHEYGHPVEGSTFSKFSLAEKIKYIEFGNRLTDYQQRGLPDQVLSMYANQNPGHLSVDSWARLKPSDFKYAIKQIMDYVQYYDERDTEPGGSYLHMEGLDLLPDVTAPEFSEEHQNTMFKMFQSKPPRWAFVYARTVVDPSIRWKKVEPLIARDPKSALEYAEHILGRRWPEAESVIAQNADLAYEYARNVIEGRFPEAEPVIVQNAGRAYLYAMHVLKQRWPAAEEKIAKAPALAYYYAHDVVQGRFPEGERVLAQAPDRALNYARYVLEDRFPEGEPVILQDPSWAYSYAVQVIKGRWPEAEPIIAKDARYAYDYAFFVIRGRWPMGEPAIRRSEVLWADYKELVRRTNNDD